MRIFVAGLRSWRDVYINDLPPEFSEQSVEVDQVGNWTKALRVWADQQLSSGNTSILDEATPLFESTLIDTALAHTSGRRRDAADLLGWGRNTLTRKIKECGNHQKKIQQIDEP